MHIQYSEYSLTAKKRANRHTTTGEKNGVYLRASDGFADYFPHAVLGDRPVEQFLSEFKFQNDEYDRKILELLQKDPVYQKTPAVEFKNHQLWTGDGHIDAPIVKYKLMEMRDDLYLTLLEKGLRLRFDGNALFSRQELIDFMQNIPSQFHAQIEYMEDPIPTKDWSDLPLSAAQDFVTGVPFDYYIFKPNAEFYPSVSVPIIFSAYVGSDLGSWHCYCELVEKGSRELVHGVVTENFYEEQKVLFRGNYHQGFTPDLAVANELYKDLSLREWKTLCSI